MFNKNMTDSKLSILAYAKKEPSVIFYLTQDSIPQKGFLRRNLAHEIANRPLTKFCFAENHSFVCY